MGTLPALNLSCWQECCSIFILTCTWGMTNLNFTFWNPPNPSLCSFLYLLFLFYPEQFYDHRLTVRGMKRKTLLFFVFLVFLFERQWFWVSKCRKYNRWVYEPAVALDFRRQSDRRACKSLVLAIILIKPVLMMRNSLFNSILNKSST